MIEGKGKEMDFVTKVLTTASDDLWARAVCCVCHSLSRDRDGKQLEGITQSLGWQETK